MLDSFFTLKMNLLWGTNKFSLTVVHAYKFIANYKKEKTFPGGDGDTGIVLHTDCEETVAKGTGRGHGHRKGGQGRWGLTVPVWGKTTLTKTATKTPGESADKQTSKCSNIPLVMMMGMHNISWIN